MQDIVQTIVAQTGQDLSSYEFTIPEIKAVGTYECSVRLHPEVVGTFSVVIQRDKAVTIKKTEEKKKK